MLIGETTAEEIKQRIGSAFPGAEVREMEVKGRNLAEGIPRASPCRPTKSSKR